MEEKWVCAGSSLGWGAIIYIYIYIYIYLLLCYLLAGPRTYGRYEFFPYVRLITVDSIFSIFSFLL